MIVYTTKPQADKLCVVSILGDKYSDPSFFVESKIAYINSAQFGEYEFINEAPNLIFSGIFISKVNLARETYKMFRILTF